MPTFHEKIGGLEFEFESHEPGFRMKRELQRSNLKTHIDVDSKGSKEMNVEYDLLGHGLGALTKCITYVMCNGTYEFDGETKTCANKKTVIKNDEDWDDVPEPVAEFLFTWVMEHYFRQTVKIHIKPDA